MNKIKKECAIGGKSFVPKTVESIRKAFAHHRLMVEIQR